MSHPPGGARVHKTSHPAPALLLAPLPGPLRPQSPPEVATSQ
ncbi:hypothetical protein ACP70R_042359 [Stipagrostis hirtigluma subsp. patula]